LKLSQREATGRVGLTSSDVKEAAALIKINKLLEAAGLLCASKSAIE